MEYQHVQYGYTWLFTSIVMVVVSWFSLPETFEESVWAGVGIVAFTVAIIALTVWFSRLEVTVRNGQITTSFGLGKPHRVVELSDVESAKRVRNKWYYGLGVRGVPDGWMYNVWGLDAVELRLTSGGVFRIGTDEPDQLQAAVSLAPRGSN